MSISTPTRAALLIASWIYDDPAFSRLRTPAKDIRSLSRVLANPDIGNFEVQTIENGKYHIVREHIQGFFHERKRDDLLLLYFGCHGVKNVNGRLHFVASNTQQNKLDSTSIESLFVNDQMEQCLSKKIILVLDCCYSGAFPLGASPRMTRRVDVKEQLEGRGRVVITASSAIEYAYEGDNLYLSEGQEHSFFTGALVQGLESGEADSNLDGWVDIEELYEYVFERVRERTPHQTPGILYRASGKVFVARSARDRVTMQVHSPASSSEGVLLVPRIPDVLDERYEVERLAGSGNLAEVFKGRDRLLKRAVAVKVLLPQYANDPSFLAQFEREAESAAALQHSNIVAVYDVGIQDNVTYIIMEFVDGRSLGDILRDEGPLLPLRAAEIAVDISSALATAHSRRVIHRDIKPDNIMITQDGNVKVMDFGLALTPADNPIAGDMHLSSVASYSSPEIIRGSSVDTRSDLYSLGCVLYHMVTGVPPFTGPTPIRIAERQVGEKVTPPKYLNPDVPDKLDATIVMALAKSPDERYQSALELRQDLQRFVTEELTRVSPPEDGLTRSPSEKDTTYEVETRTGIGWIVVSLLALVIVGVAAFFITRAITDPTDSVRGSGEITPGGSTSNVGDKLPSMDGQAQAFVALRLSDGLGTSEDNTFSMDYPKGSFHVVATRFDRVEVETKDRKWTAFARGQAQVRGSNTPFAFKLTVTLDEQDGHTRMVLRLYESTVDLEAPGQPVYQASGDMSGDFRVSPK